MGKLMLFHFGSCTAPISLFRMHLHELTLLEVQTSTMTLLSFCVVILYGLSGSSKTYRGRQQLMTWNSILKNSYPQISSGFSTLLCPARKNLRQVKRLSVWYSPSGKTYVMQCQRENGSNQNICFSV
jgi:hypothetical protein